MGNQQAVVTVEKVSSGTLDSLINAVVETLRKPEIQNQMAINIPLSAFTSEDAALIEDELTCKEFKRKLKERGVVSSVRCSPTERFIRVGR